MTGNHNTLLDIISHGIKSASRAIHDLLMFIIVTCCRRGAGLWRRNEAGKIEYIIKNRFRRRGFGGGGKMTS